MGVPASVLAIGLLGCGFAVMGCGSNDCAETATCDAPGDGSAGGDVVAADAMANTDGTVEAGGSESGAGSDGDSGVQRFEASAGSDAMTLPDVAFVDAAVCGTGSVCIDAVPVGWSGPLILSDQATGPPTPAPPPCPSSYPNDALDGYLSPTSPAAVCTCSCGGLSGASCGNVQLVGYSDSACITTCSDDELPVSTCVGPTACSSSTGSASATEPPMQGGSCAPAGTSMNPPSAWAETARACQPVTVGGGCSGSQVCVASPPSPFSAKLCVMHAGTASCPAGAYSRQRVFYTSTQDSRSCAPACTCAAPTGLACAGGTATVFTGSGASTGCAGTTTGIPVDGQCHAVGGFPFASSVYAEATTQPVPPAGASCTASSPQPTGAVTASGPTTLCCQP